ncbi:MAG: radical SAM protein, partial [Patescibacteria group bacterium]
MELLNHKIFFIEEFFGSRIYNSQDQEEHFFDEGATANIKKIFSGDYNDSADLQKLRDILTEKRLLTSDVSYIEHKEAIGLSAPLKISLNITEKCNLRCKHCLSDAGNFNPNELTTAELFKLIDQMREAGSFFITIGGGEPLLRDDLFKIIKYARDNFIAVSVVTNGLLIDEVIAKKFDALKLDTITVSLDGLEKNHEQIRGVGNFRKTIDKMKILRENCKTAKLAARVTINSLNINDYKELIGLAEDLSLDLVRFTPILLLGRAKENQELLISQDEYIRFLRDIQNIKTKIKLILPNQGDGRKWWVSSDDFGCHCGKEACWITQTGDFYPCIFFGDKFLAGNIK